MSRHLFLCSENMPYHAVLIGWDQPLQQFFLVITKITDEEEPFYSNLLDPDFDDSSLDTVVKKLNEFNIQLPGNMLLEVAEDARNHLGNKDVLHQIVNHRYKRQLGFSEDDIYGTTESWC